MRGFTVLAACMGALAVALGAFGAHALRGRLDDAALQVWRTAVDYQFWHALALLAIAQSSNAAPRWLHASATAFVVGVVLFCGSLYALALGAPHLVGAITPFGGIALIAGWLLLAVAFLRSAKRKTH
ncbi:MAG TPA: DUF423 domain-containing protein [Rudaea sp.]|jgi:uncharacterized membrane protein YgdD (TMEM256/DUF423 family)|uniref:DUF423 domain-containing protein n=1 Tax=Rudaea sp. TaxID=2136325 RepID=UPI002F9584FF